MPRFQLTPEQARQEIYRTLEEGKYPQGRGGLRSKEGFCCLGVICDLYIKLEGNGRWDDRIFVLNEKDHVSFLPEKVRDWCGIRPLTQHQMANWNDSRRMSFREISQRLRMVFNETQKESKRPDPYSLRDS